MNLALHHFCKEFRYLRLRWFGFLALLAFDMLVNLEWLLQMRAGVASPGWLTYLPIVVLLAGLSLLLSCPEDRPGSDRSFISTRPMPLQAYWVARTMVWLLLIVLPAVLQNGLYLVLSERPLADILRGMGERFALGAGYTAWLLPMLALWQWKEFPKMLLILVPTVLFASKLLDSATLKPMPISYYQTGPMLLVGWALFAGLSGAVVWGHLVYGFSFRRRLALTGVAALICLSAARFGSRGDSLPVEQDKALVQKLSPQLNVEFDLAEAVFESSIGSFGPMFRGKVQAPLGMKDVHVRLHPLSTVFAQAGSTRRVDSASIPYTHTHFDSRQSEVHCGNLGLGSFFPRGTLLMSLNEGMPKWTRNDQPLTSLAAFSEPYPSFDEPLDFETEFLVDWYQRDLALEIPVVVGAEARCDEVRWKILRVSPAEGPKPGAMTLFLHQESRSHWDAENGHAILLHLPGQRLVRLEPVMQKIVSQRGDDTGWKHALWELTWSHVFNHVDGEATGADLAAVRLILLRSRFLGQSRTSWKSPEVRLTDLPSYRDNELRWNDAPTLYRGREAKAFQDRLATLTPLSPESSQKEARRFVYDLFSAASYTRAVYTNSAHPQIVQAFEPLGSHHLPLMLELRSYAWPGWSNRPPNNLLEKFVTDDHREDLIDHAPENAKLANLVVRKGWAEEARRHKARILSYPVLLPGAEELMLAWKDDPEVVARLLKEARHDFNGGICWALDKQAELRPQVEALVEKRFEDTVLIMASSHSSQSVKLAADYGSEEALEVCLRWVGLFGDTDGSLYPYPTLLSADGGEWDYHLIPDHERWPLFRRLKVSDFEYVAEKRAWRLLKP